MAGSTSRVHPRAVCNIITRPQIEMLSCPQILRTKAHGSAEAVDLLPNAGGGGGTPAAEAAVQLTPLRMAAAWPADFFRFFDLTTLKFLYISRNDQCCLPLNRRQ